jgi:hypothetical protein
MNYLVSIADKFEIEILEVRIENIKLNTKEYPASQVRGGLFRIRLVSWCF